MNTLRLNAASKYDLKLAAALIRSGELVAMPTETVYGLAANALDPDAVSKIFRVKNRPQDNPLIAHIASKEELYTLAENIPELAFSLAGAFWPGPLTMVLHRKPVVPDAVTAGLQTVALRCPAHPAALALITQSGLPLAAPSANLSKRPSPTSAEHVLADLDGKIAAVLDGGPCGVGLESTIVDLSAEKPVILRPGGLSAAALDSFFRTDPRCDSDEKPRAPGMKYRHYSPDTPLAILRGDLRNAAEYLHSLEGLRVAVLCPDSESGAFADFNTVTYGSDSLSQARQLFAALRKLDTLGAERAFARLPDGGELYDAIENRMLKAAGLGIIEVSAPC